MKVDELLSGARDAISAKRVFGEPIGDQGVTVIPVAKVGGGGGGGGDTEGNGGGFGLAGKPAGAYVITAGEVKWKPAYDLNRIVLGWQPVAALAVLVCGIAARWLMPRSRACGCAIGTPGAAPARLRPA